MAGFEGFSKETIQFLKGIKKNNTKEWFNDHRKEYQTYVMEPAKAFVEAMGEELKKITPNINAIPSVNKSIRRINRDTRFSKDKRPYKDHLDFQFWEGGDKPDEGSGFWLRIEVDQVCTAAGICGFEKERLNRFRNAVAEDKSGNAFEKAVQKAQKQGFDLTGLHYKSVPKGFDKEHPRGKWLKYNALRAGKPHSLPDEFFTPKFVRYCLKEYKQLLPMHVWLMENVV